jgi:hypothetical protein
MEFVHAVQDSMVLHGELRRTLLAAGIVMTLVCIAWAIQECGVRKSVVALGWFGLCCLGGASIISLLLIAIGVI